jgi:hypothetical protein
MQGMRELLRGNLGRSLRPLPALDRLAAAWPVACGSALASRGEVVGYDKGIVRVVVSSAEWMQPLAQMRLVLTSDLARIAGVPVSAIHFERAANSQQETANSGPAGNRKPKR